MYNQTPSVLPNLRAYMLVALEAVLLLIVVGGYSQWNIDFDSRVSLGFTLLPFKG